MHAGEGMARRVLLRTMHETGVFDELEPDMRVLAVVALSHQVCSEMCVVLCCILFIVCVLCVLCVCAFSLFVCV